MVGEAMSWGDPSAQKYWSLLEVIERMQGAYCGTLTAEYDHLHSRWVAVHLIVSEGISSHRLPVAAKKGRETNSEGSFDGAASP